MRADTTDPAEFAKNYLEAAAGDFAGAGERVKQFLSPDAAATFKPPAEVKVVRLIEDPLVNPGKPVVIKTREVGTLGPKGILEPAGDDRPANYELTLRQVEGQPGLFVTDPPKVLLLSDTALDRFYTKRTIYFWNQDHTGLVPDLRYLPVDRAPRAAAHRDHRLADQRPVALAGRRGRPAAGRHQADRQRARRSATRRCRSASAAQALDPDDPSVARPAAETAALVAAAQPARHPAPHGGAPGERTTPARTT